MTVPAPLFLMWAISVNGMYRIVHGNLRALHASEGAVQSPGSNLLQGLSGTPTALFSCPQNSIFPISVPHCMV